jgi:hypothetical protein
MSDPPENNLHRSVRGMFHVVPRLNGAGKEVYMVVAPTGVELYVFENIRDAIAEAAELNGQPSRRWP